ncbi:MAG: hypothetical protein V4437_02630 [Patescibacteria group bacterium]
MHINPTKTGLAVGVFLGLFHFVWSLLVAFNWGQALIDFIFDLHMIHPVYTVGPFSLGMATGLIAVTALIGFILGSAFAIIWNRLHRA